MALQWQISDDCAQLPHYSSSDHVQLCRAAYSGVLSSSEHEKEHGNPGQD
jgi:hypothetical protein